MTVHDGALFKLLVAQQRFVYLVVILLAAAGLWTGFRLPSAIYPELAFSRITIVTEGSALGARQLLFSVTRPLEEAVGVVPGVTRVQSRTIRGGSEINLTFSERTDMQYALQQTQARVNQVQPGLPDGTVVRVELLTPSIFPILSYNLEGGDAATLYDIAQYQIRPLLSRVPGVGQVEVQASDRREMEVIADPSRLAEQGMTYDDLAGVIRQATMVTAVGRVPVNYKQFLIVTTTEAHSAQDIGDIAVGRGLRVRDVATVSSGTEDHVRIIAGDGRPAALLNITRQIGGNTVAIADSIAAIAAMLRQTLPADVVLKPVYDQAALVRDAAASVRDAMLIGAALAVIVLLLFLQHGRVTAISASAIPLTMAITVFIMGRLGQTFNLMTLGAMAVAIGLVIDDAVVVTENIVRHIRLSPGDRAGAISDAVQELIWPVTTSTITTVVVFAPLRLLTGVEGQFFRALSVTLTVAVLVSLVLALSIIPLLSEQYLTDDVTRARGGWGERVLARVGEGLETLSDGHERSLGAVLRHGRWMGGVVLSLTVIGVAGFRLVGTGFLPEMDEGAFVLDYVSPGGTALAETDRQVHLVEELLAATPEVAATSRRTGAEMGLFATAQNAGDIVVRLTAPGARNRASSEVIDDVRVKLSAIVPRLRLEFVQVLSDVINDLAGASAPVEVRLYGADLDSLEAYGVRLASVLQSVPGLEDIYDGVSEPGAEMEMNINGVEANLAGLTPAVVSSQVRGALLGTAAGDVRL